MYAIASLYDLLHGQILPDAWQDDAPRISDAVVEVPWETWAMVGLGLVIVASLEGGYRLWKREQALAEDAADIAIDIPQQRLTRERAGLTEKTEDDFYRLLVKDVRITNRSREYSASLGIALRIEFVDNPTNLRRLYLKEDDFGYLGKEDEHRRLKPWVRCPVALAPATTIVGHLGFLVPPALLDRIGEDFGAIVRRSNESEEVYLEVTDYISGKIVVVKVPGHYPATS